MIYHIVIDGFRFTSLNVMNSAKHWGKRSRLKKIDRDFVWAYSKSQFIPQAAGKRRVSLEVFITGRQKETDPDALWKSCLDALVKCAMLIDDTAEYCELGTVVHHKAEETKTIIVLEDIP